MKITPWFIHPQAIIFVYDFLLSDEYNQSYIKTGSGVLIKAFWSKAMHLSGKNIHMYKP